MLRRLVLGLVTAMFIGVFTAMFGAVAGCQAGNACGDADVVCRSKCGGGTESNICWKDRVCSNGEWICFCHACTIDLGVKDLFSPDQSLPKDFSSVD